MKVIILQEYDRHISSSNKVSFEKDKSLYEIVCGVYEINKAEMEVEGYSKEDVIKECSQRNGDGDHYLEVYEIENDEMKLIF